MAKILITHNVLEIPERLREIDPELRIFYDDRRRKYEVWGADKTRSPYLLSRFDVLDNRALTAIKHAYWIARQNGRPYKDLLRRQSIEDDRLERQRQADLQDLNYGFRDDLKYCGKVVGCGATF